MSRFKVYCGNSEYSVVKLGNESKVVNLPALVDVGSVYENNEFTYGDKTIYISKISSQGAEPDQEEYKDEYIWDFGCRVNNYWTDVAFLTMKMTGTNGKPFWQNSLNCVVNEYPLTMLDADGNELWLFYGNEITDIYDLACDNWTRTGPEWQALGLPLAIRLIMKGSHWYYYGN